MLHRNFGIISFSRYLLWTEGQHRTLWPACVGRSSVTNLTLPFYREDRSIPQNIVRHSISYIYHIWAEISAKRFLVVAVRTSCSADVPPDDVTRALTIKCRCSARCTNTVHVAARVMEHFSYHSQEEWEKFPGCFASGCRQSPIDIVARDAHKDSKLHPLVFTRWDNTVAGTLANNGHSVQFSPDSHTDPSGFTDSNGVGYVLKQFHFHWGRKSGEGSEHSVDGTHFDAEIHFVFAKDGGGKRDVNALSVVGVLCKEGHACSDVWEQLKVPTKSGCESHVHIKYKDLMPDEAVECGDYFTYEGSLTTPPCSEIVQWVVLKEPISIPEEFLSKLRGVEKEPGRPIAHNFRDLQPMNARKVYCTEGSHVVQA